MVICAGGVFRYVGAMHDSFPHALELAKAGYNAFALIYRPSDPYTDLARAIAFIFANSKELEVDTTDYLLWGGSAGARMVTEIGSYGLLPYGYDLPKPNTVIMQYTGLEDYNKAGEVPTFACVGRNDYIANWQGMQRRINNLKALGVNTEFHVYDGLAHGFGLGEGTIAKGWINLAINFWLANMSSQNF